MSNTLIFLLMMVPGTLFLGINDNLVRKILRDSKINSQLLVALDFGLTALLLLIPLLIVGIPKLQPGFWNFFLVSILANGLAQWAWYEAFKREDASLISPLRLLTPPLVILTAFLVLGEQVNLLGAVGIFITIFGLWLLGSSQAKFENVRFRDLVKRRGIILGILGAIAFAVAFPVDKKALGLSSVIFLPAIGFASTALFNFIIGLARSYQSGQSFFEGLKGKWRFILLLPLAHSVGGFLTLASLPYTLAAYAASVKRLWSFWAVLFSGKFLQEQNIGKKLLATAIMLAGIAVTVLFG